jgi:uncharacterized C2H2 Zn-finger protein
MADDYRCSMCDVAFQSGQELEKHNGEMHATGQIAGSGSQSKEEVATGIGVERVTNTTGEEAFMCPKCNSAYPSREALAAHASTGSHVAA